MRLGPGLDVDLVQFDRDYVARFGLYGFVRRAWIEVTGAPLIDSELVREICSHLQAVSRGESDRMLINLPPGTGKSLIADVIWPAWEWAEQGRLGLRRSGWIFSSYSQDLMNGMARTCRDLLCSPWYQSRWPLEILDQGVTDFRVAGGGRRVTTTIGAKATGFHADHFVVDDAVNQVKAGFTSTRTADLVRAGEYCLRVVPTRVLSKKGDITVLGQMLVRGDPSCVLIEAGGYDRLMLPMHFDPKRACRTRWGGDWRTIAGELLAPGRFTEAEVSRLALELGVYASAQLEQDPGLPSGSIIKRAWLRWHGPGTDEPTPKLFDEEGLSADLAFKDGVSSDYVSITHWGRLGARFYLLDDYVHEQLDFPNTLRAFQGMCLRNPRALVKIVENKANGPALLATLQRSIAGLVASEANKDKSERLRAVSPLHRAGQVLYPNTPWGRRHAENMVSFPWTPDGHDDDVDTESQMLAYWTGEEGDAVGSLLRLAKSR